MSKYIFFDIDGTLWDDKMVIPESTKEALAKLKAKGHKIFICTGRSRGNVRAKELLDLNFDGILAACGNHIEVDGQVIYQKLMSDDMVKKVLEVLKTNHMPVVMEGPEYLWIDDEGFDQDPFIDYLYQQLGQRAKTLHGYEEGMKVNKFSCDITEKTDYQAVQKALEEDFDFIRHDEMVVEIIPKASSKATGIEWLCQHFSIDLKDTYALGDGPNDLEMLGIVGHSICMGNGNPVAKQAAEYVTDHIHEDGLYKAMVHYNLI